MLIDRADLLPVAALAGMACLFCVLATDAPGSSPSPPTDETHSDIAASIHESPQSSTAGTMVMHKAESPNLRATRSPSR
jgi:hypothetical protein